MKQLLFTLSLLSIVACKDNAKTTETTDTTTTTETAAPDPIIREEVGANENAEVASIQKKTVDDKEILLTKAKVVGSILSVEFQVNTPEGKLVDFMFPLNEVNYIDDALAKKNGLLKDDAGVYMANPLSSNKEFILLRGKATHYLVSMKFPAPPTESKTVSINIPKFGSFDEVPISR